MLSIYQLLNINAISQPQHIEVVWQCMIAKNGSEGIRTVKITTYWRFKKEKIDATMEALNELCPHDHQVVMVLSYQISKKDKELIKDYGIELPKARRSVSRS